VELNLPAIEPERYKSMIRIERVFLLLLAATAIARSQQVLVLTSGTQLEGRYDGGKADTVDFIDEQGNTQVPYL
jgi:hypothetical protein